MTNVYALPLVQTLLPWADDILTGNLAIDEAGDLIEIHHWAEPRGGRVHAPRQVLYRGPVHMATLLRAIADEAQRPFTDLVLLDLPLPQRARPNGILGVGSVANLPLPALPDAPLGRWHGIDRPAQSYVTVR